MARFNLVIVCWHRLVCVALAFILTCDLTVSLQSLLCFISQSFIPISSHSLLISPTLSLSWTSVSIFYLSSHLIWTHPGLRRKDQGWYHFSTAGILEHNTSNHRCNTCSLWGERDVVRECSLIRGTARISEWENLCDSLEAHAEERAELDVHLSVCRVVAHIYRLHRLKETDGGRWSITETNAYEQNIQCKTVCSLRPMFLTDNLHSPSAPTTRQFLIPPLKAPEMQILSIIF